MTLWTILPLVIAMSLFSVEVKAQLNTNTQCTPVLTDGSCINAFTVVFDPWGANMVWFNVTSGTVTRNASGVVSINMSLVVQGNASRTANLAMTLSGYSASGTPHEGPCSGAAPSGWEYYSNFSGTLTGTGSLSGLSINITRGSYPAFHFGNGGSTNSPNGDYGAAAWTSAQVTSLPTTGGAQGFPAVGQTRQTDIEFDLINCTSTVCSNITNGGTIGSNQSISSGGDPAALTNVTSPSGGSGTIEYMWLQSTTIPCPAAGDASWQTISGASSATYDPGPLTQSTCFMRCSRRAGCTPWDGESNSVTVTVTSGGCSCPGNLISNSSFESGTTGWNWWGGTLYTGSYAAVCGANSGQFQVSGSDGGVYQDKTGIAPGTGINLAVYAGVHNTGYYASVGVQFYTSTWQYISGVETEVNSQLPSMGLYNVSATVPPDAYYVRFFGYANGDWLKLDGLCMTTQTCTAEITGLFFNDLVGTNDIAITNGGTYSYDDLAVNYNLEATVTGTVESVVFTTTGAQNTTNTENSAPWNGTFNPNTGTYHVNVKVYAQDGGQGALCDEANFSFTVLKCYNVTNGGTIGSNQSICSGSTPAPLTNVTSPSGGSGTLEYLWLQSTTIPCPPVGSASWTAIPGATSATYAPGVLTQTTCFLRCSRRLGCTEYDGESNAITITVNPKPTIVCETNVNNAGWVTDADCSIAVCAGSHVQLSVNPNVSTVNWTGPNGFTATGVNDIVVSTSITSTQAGNYVATLTDANGCSATKTITVTVNPQPTASISGTTTICNGNSTSLTASGGGTYLWNTGATSAVISVNPTATTTYTVTVTGGNGCTNTATKTVTVNALPNAAATASPATICTGQNSVITATGGGTYLWSTGATTSFITVSPSATTTYTVTVTGGNGCTKTATATVTKGATPTAVITGTNIVCSGTSTTLTASGGTSYLWSTGATTAAINVSPSALTTYTVTVTNASGCTATASDAVQVNNCNTPCYTRTPSNSTECGGTLYGFFANNLVNGDGSNSSEYYSLSTPAFQEFSDGTALFTGTITNAQGSQFSLNVYFSGRTTTTPAGSPHAPNCAYTPSTTDYYYYTSTTAVVNGLGNLAGAQASFTRMGPSFQVGTGANGNSNVYGASGWMSLVSVVSQPTNTAYTIADGGQYDININLTGSSCIPCLNLPPTASITGTNSICNGQSTTLTATGGGTYLWSTGATAATITVNPTTTTTYTVTVTGALGCTTTATRTVTVLPLPNATATAVPASICLGQSSTITATGGGTYLWNTGATAASISVTPAITTTYTVTVTGANGCTKTATATVTVLPLPSANASASPGTICAGLSSTLTATGGGTYLWSTGATAASITVSPLTTTTYTVTVTGANGCTKTATATVTVLPLPNATATPSPATICDGQSSTITATGGGTYLWSTGATSATISVSPTTTTTYTVTVTGANGCTKTATATVTVNPLPNATAGASPATICVGQSSTLTATGGGTYLWNTGATSASISVSPASTTTYTVTVTSASGCTKTATATVTVNPLPNATATPSPATICNGQSSTITATGGGTYLWNTGVTTATITVSPTTTTTYTVTVTGANGCTKTATATVTVLPLPNATASASPATICVGQFTTITASGGGTYLWNTGATSAAISVNPAATTTYTVTVTGANGCTKTATATVTVNPLPVAGLTKSGDRTCALPVVTLTATPSSGMTYAWSVGATPVVGTNTATVNSGGTYTVTVTNATTGCSATATVTVSDDTGAPTVNLNSPTITCLVPSVSVIATASPSGAVTYTWSVPVSVTNPGNVSSFSTTVGGTYAVTVSKNNGCTAASTTTVNLDTNLPPATATATPSAICTGQSSTITATGGGTYLWNTGATMATISVSPTTTTTYTVTVTGANGCTKTATATVTVNPLPNATASASPATICVGQSSTITASGGSTYLWNTGATSAAITVSPIATTTYTVTVTSASGCTKTATATVTVNPLPNATATPSPATICDGQSSTITATGGGTYLWNTGATTATITVSPTTTTTYTVTVTGANGCTKTATATVTVLPLPNATASASPATICVGQSSTLTATGGGTYLWNTGATSASISVSPAATTTYTVTVT
ncbi:MAG: hypothetical protein IT262_16485, partial [Saprospiraceae bacterium]|nr:hypothetical protein [Saprospiraceae bacterium]